MTKLFRAITGSDTFWQCMAGLTWAIAIIALFALCVAETKLPGY